MLKQKALTLIELMIGLLITGVVMASALAMYGAAVKHSRATAEQGQLDKSLHHVLGMMVRDIRRAGYWASASTSSENSFMQSGTDITVNSGNNCILLTYDHNADGSLPAVNSGIDDERYGYRLMNNALQFRPNNAAFDCTASAASWANLTDPNVLTVTAFSVTKTDTTTANMTLRNITVSITGQLVSDTSITKTLTQTVKVQNDKYG